MIEPNTVPMRFAVVEAENAAVVWALLPYNYVIVSGIDPQYLIGGLDTIVGDDERTLESILDRFARLDRKAEEVGAEVAVLFVREQQR